MLTVAQVATPLGASDRPQRIPASAADARPAVEPARNRGSYTLTAPERRHPHPAPLAAATWPWLRWAAMVIAESLRPGTPRERQSSSCSLGPRFERSRLGPRFCTVKRLTREPAPRSDSRFVDG